MAIQTPERVALAELPTPTSWIVSTGQKASPTHKTAAQARLEAYQPSPAKSVADIENRMSAAENRREMEVEQKQYKGAHLSARKLERVMEQSEQERESLKTSLFVKHAAAEQRASMVKQTKSDKAAVQTKADDVRAARAAAADEARAALESKLDAASARASARVEGKVAKVAAHNTKTKHTAHLGEGRDAAAAQKAKDAEARLVEGCVRADEAKAKKVEKAKELAGENMKTPLRDAEAIKTENLKLKLEAKHALAAKRAGEAKAHKVEKAKELAGESQAGVVQEQGGAKAAVLAKELLEKSLLAQQRAAAAKAKVVDKAKHLAGESHAPEVLAHSELAAESLKASLSEKHAAAAQRVAFAKQGKADAADKAKPSVAGDVRAASEAELDKRRAMLEGKLDAASARAAAQRKGKVAKAAAHLGKVKAASPRKARAADDELEQRVLHAEADELPQPEPVAAAVPADEPLDALTGAPKSAQPARCVIS